MRLLISNDDGVFATGIRVLANTLATAGHDILVVCPDQERSATGHGLTIHNPLRVEAVEAIFHPAVKAWACSGTPSDCVKLALSTLMDEAPDYVLSGINHGSNLGTDVLYSGTVSAAMEGLIEGNIPSIALSLANSPIRNADPDHTRDRYPPDSFEAAALFAQTLLAHFTHHPLPEAMLLNINIPSVPLGSMAGVTIARQGRRRYINLFDKRTDPRGKTYYWLSGEVIEDLEEGNSSPPALPGFPTDVEAIRRNYITVTPLDYNLTATTQLEKLHTFNLIPLDFQRKQFYTTQSSSLAIEPIL